LVDFNSTQFIKNFESQVQTSQLLRWAKSARDGAQK